MQQLNHTKICCSCFYFWWEPCSPCSDPRSRGAVNVVKQAKQRRCRGGSERTRRRSRRGLGQKARMSQRELDKVLCQIKEKCRQEEGRVLSDPPPVAWILDHSGHLALQVAPDQKCYTFGRNYDCDVVLKDRAVSRYHVRLEVGREKMAIELISTTNSMVVNGTYVASPDQYR